MCNIISNVSLMSIDTPNSPALLPAKDVIGSVHLFAASAAAVASTAATAATAATAEANAINKDAITPISCQQPPSCTHKNVHKVHAHANTHIT